MRLCSALVGARLASRFDSFQVRPARWQGLSRDRDAVAIGFLILEYLHPLEVPMQLIEQVSDGVAIVEAHGRIDSVTARDLNEKLITLIDSGTARIVLYLKN